MAVSCRTRPLVQADAADALSLYNALTFGPKTQDETAFRAVINHQNTQIIGAEFDGKIVSMLTLHLLPNVTWNARPYGLIENVITAEAFRRRGFGALVMRAACQTAWAAQAYKVMLMTGQKRTASGFYHSVGFSSEDKHAMVIRAPDQ